MIEVYLKAVIVDIKTEGEKHSGIKLWLLKSIEKKEKYACNTMLLHAAVTLVVFMVVNLRFTTIWNLIGTSVSVLVGIVCTTQWILVKEGPRVLDNSSRVSSSLYT